MGLLFVVIACSGMPHSQTGLCVAPEETSVSNASQVVGQFLDRVGCYARLYCFWVMCEEDCLFCLDDDDSFLSLFVSHGPSAFDISRKGRTRCGLLRSVTSRKREERERAFYGRPSSRTDFCHPLLEQCTSLRRRASRSIGSSSALWCRCRRRLGLASLGGISGNGGDLSA